MRISLPVKLLAALGFFWLAAIAFTGVGIIALMDNTGKQMTDPVAIAEAVKAIGFTATPVGYTVPKALHVKDGNLLIMEHTSDKQMVYLLCFDDVEDTDDLESGKQLENTSRFIFSRDFEPLNLSDVKEKSKIALRPGGPELRYQIGNLSDAKGTVYSGMVGLVRSAKKLLIVESVKPGANTFDKASVLEILRQMDGL